MTESAEQRSRTMRAVKSKNTVPELSVRRLLYAMGYRYRLHLKDLPGKPDIVFPGRRKAIFVHGCFWHGHDCPRGARTPRAHRSYWEAKIERNRARDVTNAAALEEAGWSVLCVWECELHHEEALLPRLRTFLDGSPFIDGLPSFVSIATILK